MNLHRIMLFLGFLVLKDSPNFNCMSSRNKRLNSWEDNLWQETGTVSKAESALLCQWWLRWLDLTPFLLAIPLKFEVKTSKEMLVRRSDQSFKDGLFFCLLKVMSSFCIVQAALKPRSSNSLSASTFYIAKYHHTRLFKNEFGGKRDAK